MEHAHAQEWEPEPEPEPGPGPELSDEHCLVFASIKTRVFPDILLLFHKNQFLQFFGLQHFNTKFILVFYLMEPEFSLDLSLKTSGFISLVGNQVLN